MKSRMNKLALNQETIRNLTAIDGSDFGNPNSVKSCKSVCGLPCTPVVGKQ
jgi:hypothetical protein